ncbi:bifunctional GNAT family N-acetyltransferase/GrpB family protein [Bacillus velezensis]|uniref:bifunctional GNAT family N-acetyltransferase/GrpB family protein n=1 Tax=Bacillus TaxID=1386 RepID=UPI000B92C55C|nr:MULTISPECIES: bifunctional GNAT family N-acetyltransferase/GrpB family protein [Bacillus amyloliquefaciens group]ASS64432.1 Dephospho-CoA kinase [Bacillus velezensis]ATC49707.1 Dephospho-CoA kinase [Bacillus velezensis]MCW5193499.1 Dephospho-CoA kinase [Bacillus amyloliquefaciens]MEC3631404.1 bifunctional GNAT family N-acetyltransferase/GrpB family protein [Bacillus velezensis]MED4524531.1 bifunctional GNAT family N-acetyltransferase/GrpB family protein [Bacillus velezensis]
MITFLRHTQEQTAREIAAVQRCSYQKEAELIGFFGIPALHETPDDIQRSRETFAGFKEKDRLAGVISYEKKGYDLVICRLTVHPSGFRKGIGQALIQFVIDQNRDAQKIEAATASQNVPAVSLYLKTGFIEAGQTETPEGLTLSFFHLYPKRKAEVVPYKPEWKEMFEREKADLIRIFGPALHSVSHIGSTSIPGMAAKPVIDILAEVKDILDADRFSPQLEALGYEAKGENGIEGRRFFQKGGSKRTHHVHIYETGHPDVKRHLLFRDYLTAKPEKAAQYMELKRRLAKAYPYDMAKYSEGKNDWIKAAEQEAKDWESGLL